MEDKEYQELYDKGFDDGFLGEEIEPEENEDIEEVETEEEVEETTEDIDTEEENEDLEQPDETEENQSEDEESEDTEETEENEDSIEEEKKGRTIKWKNQEIFIDDNEIDNFIQKGFDYTQKTMDLAKYRPFIEMINENNLTPEELATLTAAKNGNTDALGKIIGAAGVDVFDINEESDYKPEVKIRNYELDDVIETIQSDTQYGQKIDQYIASIPEQSKKIFIENPQVLKGLYEDEKSGVAANIMPGVIKELALNPNADFLSTYRMVGQKIYNNTNSKQEVVENKKPVVNKGNKKKASLSKKNKGIMKEHEDVWSNDELYEKYKRMTDPRFR